jgi:GrpB-like predicted nucleotidyltransferase (UPF0157 family)
VTAAVDRQARKPLTTEADLAKVVVGPVRRLDGPVVLAEPDLAWPALYEVEADRLRSTLGAAIRRVEHVGSTSVPGLAAKPIIDILLVVDDSSDESTYLPRLEAAGYRLVLREPDWHQHRVCKGPEADINLHIFSVGSGEEVRMLAFRDRLRQDPVARERYLSAKRRLASRRWEFTQQYADAKSEVIEAILAATVVDEGRT